MTIKQLRAYACSMLQEVKIQSAQLDADLILMKILNIANKSYLIAHDDEQISKDKELEFIALIKKRQNHYPLAYILNHKEFYNISLYVNEHCLIPRSDSECIVEFALNLDKVSSILDLGTGSGALALSLKYNRPNSTVWACDISDKSLEVAKLNAYRLNLEVNFIQSSWFESLDDKRFDLIVSNPPYIKENDPHLFQNGLNYEPQIALVSENEGLSDLYKIISKAKDHLNNNSHIILEHGYDQGDRVIKMLEEHKFLNIQKIYDLSKIHRATYGFLKEAI